MVFASAIFLFLFLPITIIGYFLIKPKYRNFWLFIMSLVFYAWGGLIYAILFIFSAYINFLFGIWMEKNRRRKKLILSLSIVWNLGILAYFKYSSFILLNLQAVIQIFIPSFKINIVSVPLPIGISFFTFQIMTYVIDLYREEIKVQKKFINLGLYIMLFPQLIAGPIVRYIDIEKEINNRKVDINLIDEGIKRFILGLGKKIFIANIMGTWADTVFNTPLEKINTPLAWLGIFGYTMQIFFDFSAYSDMAIGLGKIFGFHFLENFNYPYISRNIQEFWRRWHISLSQWFKDYLYIPLGGNRKGKIRTYINLLTVFFLTGLWHGASWNFIFWGIFHGLFLIIERLGLKKFLEKIPKILQHFYTMIIVIIGWVFFRSNSFIFALKYLKKLFIPNFIYMESFFVELETLKLFIAVCAIVFSTPIVPNLKNILLNNVLKSKFYYEIFRNFVYIVLFLLSVIFLAGSNFNPFIYFHF
jgi:Predicted membrane protein involved in D-alanine export